MDNYKELGLDSNMFNLSSPLVNRAQDTEQYISDRINEIVRPGGLSYYQTHAPNREFKAVIGLDNTGGKFTDIQGALNYVNTLGGGDILLQPGTYVIPSNLTIYSNTGLIGISKEKCTLTFNGGTFNISTASLGSNILFRNLEFANCANTTTGAIYLNSANQVDFLNCKFTSNRSGTLGYDIYASSSKNINIEKCFGTDSATFFYGSSSGTININGITSYSLNNDIWGREGTPGLGITKMVLSNSFLDSPASCLFGYFAQSQFNNNRFSDDVQAGTPSDATIHIVKHPNSTSASNNSFLGNLWSKSDNGKEGVLLGTCTDVTFLANQISGGQPGGTGIDGIKLIASDNCFLIGNSVTKGGTPAYAINISDNSSGTNVVIGNNVGGTANISDSGVGDIIANNG